MNNIFGMSLFEFLMIFVIPSGLFVGIIGYVWASDYPIIDDEKEEFR